MKLNNIGIAGLVVSLLLLASCQCVQHKSKTPAKTPAFTFERFVFRQAEGGVIMVANFGNVPAGRHRVAVHSTANCTSPNGFSAGPPVLLPGTSTPVVVAVRTDGGEGTVSTTVDIAGLSIDVLEGKSVVMHFGMSGSLEALPGVPNGRVACGLIGPMTAAF